MEELQCLLTCAVDTCTNHTQNHFAKPFI